MCTVDEECKKAAVHVPISVLIDFLHREKLVSAKDRVEGHPLLTLAQTLPQPVHEVRPHQAGTGILEAQLQAQAFLCLHTKGALQKSKEVRQSLNVNVQEGQGGAHGRADFRPHLQDCKKGAWEGALGAHEYKTIVTKIHGPHTTSESLTRRGVYDPARATFDYKREHSTNLALAIGGFSIPLLQALGSSPLAGSSEIYSPTEPAQGSPAGGSGGAAAFTNVEEINEEGLRDGVHDDNKSWHSTPTAR